MVPVLEQADIEMSEVGDKEEEELNDNNAISFMIVKFLSCDFIMKKS